MLPGYFFCTHKVTFLICLIFTLWTLKLLSHMYRFIMSNQATLLSDLMITLKTLLANMYKFLMQGRAFLELN